jgi:hypothetical protein
LRSPAERRNQAADSWQDGSEHLAGLVAACYLMNGHSGQLSQRRL